ncbi:MAG: hypothetical protein ACREUT_12455 [Steroidobacteraceae bacterium]
MAATSALQEDRPVIIRWDFSLPDGSQLTDAQHADLLESAKQHLALFRTGSARCGARSGATLRIDFQCLRTLIRWMLREGVNRFSELDATLLGQFATLARRRRGYTGPTISPTALHNYYGVLIGLYRHRHLVADAIQVDPFPGISANAAAAMRVYQPKTTLYTPDAIAIRLVQGAIDFLNTAALPALAARERYLQAYATELANGRRGAFKARRAAAGVLLGIVIDTPRGAFKLEVARSLWRLIDLLYGACFIVISYLVGPRVSELMHLQVGCVQRLDESGSEATASLPTIVGAIYKAESYHGRPHRWVAPEPALHAIAVLEALSGPHRARSGRDDLWLRPRVHYFGGREWIPGTKLALRISDTKSVNYRLNRFAQWLEVPRHKGRRWWLTSHQGRKTFARFVALRDRTALYALAQHLGHRDVRQTDGAYVGTDYQLDREIAGAVLDQSICAWEQMLTSKALGGRMGAEVIARRPRFRGARVKHEIRAYARMLAETGLTLGVCEWGYCVYREEYSACRGSATAPDPVRREPSTCARCKNFCLTDVHVPYWSDQVDRYAQLLNDPRLPTQTLKIARSRLEEARSLIRLLNSPRG